MGTIFGRPFKVGVYVSVYVSDHPFTMGVYVNDR